MNERPHPNPRPSEYCDRIYGKYPTRLVAVAEEVGGLVDALEDRDAADLVAYPVSKQVTDPAFDDPMVLAETDDVSEQSELGEFSSFED